MLTSPSRPRFEPSALDCFLAQTYEHRELIIVTERGELTTEAVIDGLKLALTRASVDVVVVPDGLSIGEKRNIGCRTATGDIIAHWDDDDWYAPDWLRFGVDHLELIPRIRVMGRHSAFFADEGLRQAWGYSGRWDMSNIGATFFYHREWWKTHPFQNRNLGEDNEFMRTAAAARVYGTGEWSDMFVARRHSANTSKLTFDGSEWRTVPWDLLPHEYRATVPERTAVAQ